MDFLVALAFHNLGIFERSYFIPFLLNRLSTLTYISGQDHHMFAYIAPICAVCVRAYEGKSFQMRIVYLNVVFVNFATFFALPFHILQNILENYHLANVTTEITEST